MPRSALLERNDRTNTWPGVAVFTPLFPFWPAKQIERRSPFVALYYRFIILYKARRPHPSWHRAYLQISVTKRAVTGLLADYRHQISADRPVCTEISEFMKKI